LINQELYLEKLIDVLDKSSMMLHDGHNKKEKALDVLKRLEKIYSETVAELVEFKKELVNVVEDLKSETKIDIVLEDGNIHHNYIGNKFLKNNCDIREEKLKEIGLLNGIVYLYEMNIKRYKYYLEAVGSLVKDKKAGKDIKVKIKKIIKQTIESAKDREILIK